MSITLTAQPRQELGKTVDRLRRRRVIPAVVYGHGIPSQNLALESGIFEAVYKQAGSSSLIDLTVGTGQAVKALIHAVQRHPTTGRVVHVDFYQVKMTEKLEADIELNFIGESAAVKEQGGIFVRAMDKVKVSCLPADLVPSIDVDVSALKTFEDRIHVSDLAVPPGLTVLEKGEEVVASVTPPRSEAELASLSEKVEENVEGVEIEKKTKETEAEGEDEEAPTVPTNDKTTSK